MADDIVLNNDTTTGNGAQPAPTQPAWQSAFESFKLTDPDIWDNLAKRPEKDLPTFIKSAVHVERRLGQSLVPPEKNATPEQREAFNKRLRDIGVLPTIPESPDKYELKLDGIPEKLRSPELINEFKQFAHARGIPPEVANELLELNAKQFTNASQLFNGTLEQAQTRVAELAKRDGKI